jgi:broad specificity phosphatase PhoE
VTVLYVIRHGETHWNVEQRMQGRGDSSLTPRGREQAARHGDVIARLGGVDELLVSPLGRTRATAAIVNDRLAAAGLAAPVSFHEALMERHSGEWEGMTLSDIRQRYPDDWRAREADPFFHRPPGGENLADMESRVAGLLDELRGRTTGSRIAVVTHGIMSRVILKGLLQLAPDEAAAVRHPNALFYRLEFAADTVRHGYFLDGEGPFEGLLRH